VSDFERYEGHIHDRVEVGDVDICVIAGDDEADDVSFRAASPGHDSSLRLTAMQAIRLGLLLVAAGEDTLSRQRAPKDAGTDETEATP
jgi:hypothetical protein